MFSFLSPPNIILCNSIWREYALSHREKQRASADKEEEKVKDAPKGKIEREIISDDSGGPVIEKIKRKTAPVKKETEVEKE